MLVEHAQDSRERAAEVLALGLLAGFAIREVEPDFARVGAMVATLCAGESPEKLRTYSAMSWGDAVRDLKIGFARQYLASQAETGLPANRKARRAAAKSAKAATDQSPALPSSVDQHIGKSLVAALLKFISYRTLNPDWYAPHLDQMPLF